MPTSVEADVLRRMKRFQSFTELLKVEDIDSDDWITFNPNNIQRRLMNRITTAKLEERPSRLVILKARRMGMSTLLQSVLLHRALTQRGFKARTVAQADSNGQSLFRMTEAFYRYLPEWITDQEMFQRRQHRSGNRLFLNNDSLLQVETANNKTSGRGDSAKALHLSEVAFWNTDAERTSQSLMQMVTDRPGTLIAIESTPNGMGGFFYDQYMRAKEGESDFEAVFEPWYVFETYNRNPEGYLRYTGTGEIKWVDDEEEAEAHKHGLTDSQVAWRRYTINNKLKGDAERFREEYPSDDISCFLTSGRLYFTAPLVNGWTPKLPVLVGDIEGKKPVASLDGHGPLRIYHPPEPGRKYIGSIDPAGAQGQHHEGTDAQEDYSVIWIVRRHDMQTVAVWRGKVDPDVLAKIAVNLARYYNKAILAPEVNAEGQVVMFVLKETLRYPKLYQRNVIDKTFDTEIDKDGWKTQLNNRPAILAGLRIFLRDMVAEPGSPDKLCDERLKSEMHTFVILGGKPQAKSGTHDDCVMAAAIAIQVASEHPHVLQLNADGQPITRPKQEYDSSRVYDQEAGKRDGRSAAWHARYPK